MSSPLKNVSIQDIEKSVAQALLAATGKTVSVAVRELKFDDAVNRADVALSVWEKTANEPFDRSL